MRDGGTQHQGDGNTHNFRDSQAQRELALRCVQARRNGGSEPAGNKGPNNDEEPQRSFTNVVTLPAEDHKGAQADAVQDRRRASDEAAACPRPSICEGPQWIVAVHQLPTGYAGSTFRARVSNCSMNCGPPYR